MRAAWVVAAGLAARLSGAVEGTVHNGTTGRPAAGVEVALMKLDQGMVPVGTAKTDARGRFRFQADIAGAHGLLRAQFEGVTYTEIVAPGARTADIRLPVYSASKSAPAPEMRVIFIEPSGGEMGVNESYLFRNQSQPPVTYVGDGQGSLRFYAPPGAKGLPQVSVQGAGGVPLRVNAGKTAEPDVYQVDHPIKPGENRIDVTYVLPYKSGLELPGRTLYPDVATRIAAPSGVTLAGDALRPLGEEPQTKASIFNIARADFKLTVTGEGRLPRDRGAGEGEGGGGEIATVPAAVQQQQWMVFGFVAVILALGFYGLWMASGKPAPPPAPAAKAKKRKS